MVASLSRPTRGEWLSAFPGEADDDSLWDAEERAGRLYGSLTHDLPTTRFAWGEQRAGSYVVPGPVSRR